MNRKGQAAMEFLMTYGWAILVVLAAIGALAYFGVLSPDRFLQDKCLVTGGWSCGQYKITNTGVQMDLQNNLGVDAANATVTVSVSGGCSNVSYIPGPILNGDKTGLLTYDCAPSSGATKFKANVDVQYYKSGEEVSHTATGSLSGKVES